MKKEKTLLVEKLYQVFKTLYLVEASPSANYCWRMTVLYGRQQGLLVEVMSPVKSYLRRLRKELGSARIYLARHSYKSPASRHKAYINRGFASSGKRVVNLIDAIEEIQTSLGFSKIIKCDNGTCYTMEDNNQ